MATKDACLDYNKHWNGDDPTGQRELPPIHQYHGYHGYLGSHTHTLAHTYVHSLLVQESITLP